MGTEGLEFIFLWPQELFTSSMQGSMVEVLSAEL